MNTGNILESQKILPYAQGLPSRPRYPLTRMVGRVPAHHRSQSQPFLPTSCLHLPPPSPSPSAILVDWLGLGSLVWGRPAPAAAFPPPGGRTRGPVSSPGRRDHGGGGGLFTQGPAPRAQPRGPRERHRRHHNVQRGYAPLCPHSGFPTVSDDRQFRIKNYYG